MSFADKLRRAIKEGRVDPSRPDMGMNLAPDDCEMGVCGNKREPDSKLCSGCYQRFSIAVDRMVGEIVAEDVDEADWWKRS